MNAQTKDDKMLIGRSEYIYFVDADNRPVPAKIDTGAFRSAVHATNIVEKDGVLHFTLLGDHPVGKGFAADLTANEFQKVNVSNSFGEEEERYEIKLQVTMANQTFPARFTLANRSKKIYPILIGRKLLNGRFIIDTSNSTINRVELKKQYGIELPTDEEEGKS